MRWYETLACFGLDLVERVVKTAFVIGMLLFWITCIAVVLGMFR